VADCTSSGAAACFAPCDQVGHQSEALPRDHRAELPPYLLRLYGPGRVPPAAGGSSSSSPSADALRDGVTPACCSPGAVQHDGAATRGPRLVPAGSGDEISQMVWAHCRVRCTHIFKNPVGRIFTCRVADPPRIVGPGRTTSNPDDYEALGLARRHRRPASASGNRFQWIVPQIPEAELLAHAELPNGRTDTAPMSPAGV
jgi:hypothetical protein